jgi:signal transduction histidine kinase
VVRPSRSNVVAIGVIVVALVVIGIIVTIGNPSPVPGGGRGLPRIPAPPADPGMLLRRLGVGSVTWYACALAIAPLWWLAVRFPLTGPRTVRALSIHLSAVLVLIATTSIAHYLGAYRGSPYAPGFLDFVPVALGSNAIPLLAVAAVVHVLEARRRAVRSAIESQRLRAELADSRLAAVTAQLQPHFLFNTLQSISTLIHRDPAAADAMLVKLSDLLREVLRRSRSGLVPLDDELRMTQTYLDLARIRFGDRLRIVLDIEDETRSALVPVLLLQPLIENALKHGLGRIDAAGSVGVTARRTNGHLTLTVWDDGAGLDRASPLENTGLGNTRERLRHAFGDDHALLLRPRSEGGVEVSIRVPLRSGVTEPA